LFRRISDSDVIDGIRRQDEKVLTWLYDNYLQTIRHHVLKNSGSEADVSDVFQESVITLFRQISENNLNLTSDLKGYFFGIARNIWSSQLREKSKTTVLDRDLPDENESDDINNMVLERIVSRSFSKLQPDFQLILTLFSEGLGYDEIAKKMNLKSDTYARRKKYLAKEALIEIVKEDAEYKDYLDLR